MSYNIETYSGRMNYQCFAHKKSIANLQVICTHFNKFLYCNIIFLITMKLHLFGIHSYFHFVTYSRLMRTECGLMAVKVFMPVKVFIPRGIQVGSQLPGRSDRVFSRNNSCELPASCNKTVNFPTKLQPKYQAHRKIKSSAHFIPLQIQTLRIEICCHVTL